MTQSRLSGTSQQQCGWQPALRTP